MSPNYLFSPTVDGIYICKLAHSKTEVFMELEYPDHLSPILKDGVKNYLIDIDGTITEDVPNEEPERMSACEPFPDALETINRWYAEGHQICFFTSRTEDLKQLTVDWLDKHGFNYHSVLFGKPRGGNYHWIDNHLVRATRYKGKFTDLVERQVTIEVFED